jgi:rRNA maturation endonuclease Nob1
MLLKTVTTICAGCGKVVYRESHVCLFCGRPTLRNSTPEIEPESEKEDLEEIAA